MDEKPVATARASVMMFDAQTNSWITSGTSQGISKVQLFKHQINNTYRVVGWKLADKEVVLNCAIFRGLKYNQARPTFHQWRDTKHQVYGLNFTSKDEAEIFATAIMEALESLNQIYRQSQQLIAQQQQQQQLELQNQQFQYPNVQQNQIIPEHHQSQSPNIYQSQISGNTSVPEYAMPQKQMQQMNINTVNNAMIDNYQSYAPSLSSNGSISGISNDFKGCASEEVTVLAPAAQVAPPPPPPGPPPPSAAPPPPPPGPPPISNITLGKPPTQYDSDDDSIQGGLASQLRQTRLKSRNPVTSEIEVCAANQNKNVTSSSTLGRSGGDSMMSEMQRVLAARKKAKEVPVPIAENSDNGGSGDNSLKGGLQKNHQRSQSDCDSLNGAGNNQSKISADNTKSINLQCATLGRKGSLQPESQQSNVTRQDLDIFKKEILQEVRTMIQQFKGDIVDAIKTNRP